MDCIIIGAGIFGLSIADRIASHGARVTLIDSNGPGAGASGGILGALMPHMPESWNPKKQFQFDALHSLENHIQLLEEDTGEATGYGTVGRIMPIRKKGFHDLTTRRISESEHNWQGAYHLTIEDVDMFSSWLEKGSAENPLLGIAWDDLSARVEPKGYINALMQRLRNTCVTCAFGESVVAVDADRQCVILENGDVLTADRIILAAGIHTFAMLQQLGLADLGGAVYGQACLVKPDRLPPKMPILYDNGIYLVPHADGCIAIGSTSEKLDCGEINPKNFAVPVPGLNEEQTLLDKASELSSLVRNAPVLSRWAGYRPKAWARDPMIGHINPDSRFYIATGGFKISFGIAHHIARYVADDILGEKSSGISLPPTFQLQAHL